MFKVNNYLLSKFVALDSRTNEIVMTIIFNEAEKQKLINACLTRSTIIIVIDFNKMNAKKELNKKATTPTKHSNQ